VKLSTLALLASCTEYRVHPPAPIPPADPPGTELDAFGDPPDWTTCSEAYLGQYYNLDADHPEVLAEATDTGEPELDPIDLDQTGLWEDQDLAYQRYDTSLVFGENWWPVDQDLAEDPSYFSVRWTAWLRARDSDGMQIALGATTDGLVLLDDQVIASVEGSLDYAPQTLDISLRSGVYPLDVRMAHRAGGNAGFRFRVVSGDVNICYPDFSGDDDGEVP